MKTREILTQADVDDWNRRSSVIQSARGVPARAPSGDADETAPAVEREEEDEAPG